MCRCIFSSFFTFKLDLKCLSLGLPFMELVLSLTRLNELDFVYAFNFSKLLNIFISSVKCMKCTAHIVII